MEKKIEYRNGEVTIIWKPDLCIHSGNCVRTLPKVYHPNKRPWITPEQATTEEIINQVKRCPSGALTYKMNSDGSTDAHHELVRLSSPRESDGSTTQTTRE